MASEKCLICDESSWGCVVGGCHNKVYHQQTFDELFPNWDFGNIKKMKRPQLEGWELGFIREKEWQEKYECHGIVTPNTFIIDSSGKKCFPIFYKYKGDFPYGFNNSHEWDNYVASYKNEKNREEWRIIEKNNLFFLIEGEWNFSNEGYLHDSYTYWQFRLVAWNCENFTTIKNGNKVTFKMNNNSSFEYNIEIGEKMETTIKNCTPHTIGIEIDGKIETFEPCGIVPRIGTIETAGEPIAGIPTIKRELGAPELVPDPEPNTIFIVSAMVGAAIADRPDIFMPDTGATAIRENGQIVAVKRLVRCC